MTLIGYACHKDSVEIVSDTGWWNCNFSNWGHVSKVITIPHLKAAVMFTGTTKPGMEAAVRAIWEAQGAKDFDDLAETAPVWLQEQWSAVDDEIIREWGLTFFLVGYSPAHDRYVGYLFDSDASFEPVRQDLHFHPTPWSMWPTGWELQFVLKLLAQHPQRDELEKVWSARPELEAPTTMTGWVNLAEQAREERSLSGPAARVMIAGDLYLTRITESMTSQVDIWTFDDDEAGEQFKRMVALTQHPLAQAGSCPCDSGKSYLACCLAKQLDEPCGCTSGKTFRECCMVRGVRD